MSPARPAAGVTVLQRLRRSLPLHLRALFLLCAVRLLLPRAGLRRTLRAVDALARLQRRPQPATQLLSAVVRVSRRAVPGSACLAQAITLAGLMRAQGEDPAVVLGCRRDGDGWKAHSWVERDGAILDSLRTEHSELARYTAAGGWRPSRS